MCNFSSGGKYKTYLKRVHIEDLNTRGIKQVKPKPHHNIVCLCWLKMVMDLFLYNNNNNKNTHIYKIHNNKKTYIYKALYDFHQCFIEKRLYLFLLFIYTWLAFFFYT